MGARMVRKQTTRIAPSGSFCSLMSHWSDLFIKLLLCSHTAQYLERHKLDSIQMIPCSPHSPKAKGNYKAPGDGIRNVISSMGEINHSSYRIILFNSKIYFTGYVLLQYIVF